MASPTQTVITRQRPRSFAGPVVLIVLGVLFLMGTMGVLTWPNLFVVFAKYWPVLIIIGGVIKLFEYWRAQESGYPVKGIGAGGVFLLIFLILSGLSASGIYRHVDWDKVRDNMDINDEDFPFVGVMGKKFEFRDAQQQALPLNGSVKVTVDRGNINITPSTDNAVHVNIHKTLYADNQAEADGYSKNAMPVLLTTDGTVLSIDASRKADWKGGSADLEIQVPKKAAVELLTLRGTVSISDRQADVNVHNSRGDVTLDNISGNATVHERHGNFVANKISGDLSLEGQVDDTTISDVTGSVTLNGDYYGETKFTNIAKGVRFKSSRTDMETGPLKGEMTMGGSQLEANNITGPFRIDTRSKDIKLTSYTGDVRIDNRNADVELEPTTMGSITVSNHDGPIRLTLPATANFQLDASARGGDIETDFDVQVQNQHREAVAMTTVGKGGPKVELKTEHGTIEIKKK
jgi:DUF4097 and DUF4098 domain-containing protein YvlB